MRMSNSRSKQPIIIFKNRAIGDSIISFGALQYLKKFYPGERIIYGVPEWIYPLYKNISSDAAEIISIDLSNLSGFIRTYTKLMRLRPKIVIELFQSGRGKKLGKILNMFRASNLYFGNNHHVKDGSWNKTNIQRDMDGVRSHLKKIKQGSYLNFCPKISVNNPPEKKEEIILGIVATRETKLWPISYYHQLCQQILTDFPDVMIKIPVSNSMMDQRLKSEFLSFVQLENVKFCEVPLELLPQEIASARLYIGNDTGIKHLSIALGLTSITLFGPEPPMEWHPYDSIIHRYFYIEGLECRVKTAHFCGLNKCDSMICLKNIEVDDVYNVVIKILRGDL